MQDQRFVLIVGQESALSAQLHFHIPVDFIEVPILLLRKSKNLLRELVKINTADGQSDEKKPRKNQKRSKLGLFHNLRHRNHCEIKNRLKTHLKIIVQINRAAILSSSSRTISSLSSFNFSRITGRISGPESSPRAQTT